VSELPEISPQRKRILAAAARLFQRQGYPATTVRELAAEVELGASSLYNHMVGKQELLQEICTTSAQRFADGIKQLEDSLPSHVSVLRAVIGLHVNIALAHPESITVFNDEWRHLTQPTLQSFVQERRHYEHRLKRLFAARIAKGELRELDLDLAIPTLLGSLSWVYGLRATVPHDANAIGDRIYDLWSRGWQLSAGTS